MDKEMLRKRMLDADLPKEVVDELFKSMKDEDFVRMKDMTKEQILDVLREGSTDNTEPKVVEPKVVEPVADDADEAILMKSFEALGQYVSGVVKEVLEGHTVTVELPALTEIQSDLAELKEGMEAFKEISVIMKDMLASDEERLKGLVRDMSQASRSRLHRSLDDAQIVERVVKKLKEKKAVVQQAGVRTSPVDEFQPVIRDAQGKEYATMTDMMRGNPIAE